MTPDEDGNPNGSCLHSGEDKFIRKQSPQLYKHTKKSLLDLQTVSNYNSVYNLEYSYIYVCLCLFNKKIQSDHWECTVKSNYVISF